METVVVVVWYVLNLTDSHLLVGLTASARMGFNFLALFAGATADIVPRRTLLVIVEALLVALAVLVLTLIFTGLFIAAALSWLVSGVLVRPVEAVVRAAREIEGGNMESRVPKKIGFAPKEFHELSGAFNAMARDVATVMVQRERIQNELRHARDDLERRVEELTQELTEEITERKLAEESMTRLGAAVESLSELFVLYDPDDRLVICNKVYRNLNSETADTIVPGARFEDHQRALIEKALYDDIEGREEACGQI